MLPTHHRPPALLCGLVCLVLLVLVADREEEEEDSGPSEASLITMFQDKNFLLTLLSSEQYSNSF